jgi:hypothetical protein
MNLYEKYETLSPIYSGGLTNHLPMMLVILTEWGVEEEKIEKFLDRYSKEKGIYDLSNSILPITEFDKDYIHLTNFYINEINSKGHKETVSDFLTEHIHSLPSGLFHGLIRLYYSLITKDDLQIAQALAYFNLVSEDFSLSGKLIPASQLRQKLKIQKDNFDKLHLHTTNDNNIERYFEIIENENVRNLLFYVEKGSLEKEEVLDIILDKYVKTNNFMVLHLITGFHALIRLNAYNYNFHESLKQFMFTMQIIFLLADEQKTNEDIKLISIEEAISYKDMLTNAHEMKLFYTIMDLMKEFSNDKFKYILSNIVTKNFKGATTITEVD